MSPRGPAVLQRLGRARASARRLAARPAVASRFGVDRRALAALRVALGGLLLADLGLRARHLVAFYTDVGVLPRSTLVDLYPAARYVPHALSGAAWAQWALFAAAGVAALALLVGHRTTLATAASLVLLASLHARNPLVLNAGDALLRRLLFWGVFLPLGARWSVDAGRDDGRGVGGAGPAGPRVVSLAAAALLLQVVIVYASSGLFKLRSDRWTSGLELQYLLRVDQLTRPLAELLLAAPRALRALTWLWLAMLLGSWLLVGLTGRRRTALVALFAAMHAGMALTMTLGLFPLVSLAGLLPFLPPSAWDAVEARVASATRDARSAGRRLARTWRFDGRRVPVGTAAALARLRRALPSVPRLPSDAASVRFGSSVVAACLAGALVWNAMSVGLVATPGVVAEVRDPRAHAWDMFGGGGRADGWFVVPARLESGDRVDAFHREAVDWDRPPELARTFPSARWLRYSGTLLSSPGLRDEFAAYLCGRWNRRHADDLERLTIYFMERPVRVDGAGPVRRVRLGRYACAADGSTAS